MYNQKVSMLAKLLLGTAVANVLPLTQNDERVLNADGERGDPRPKKKTRVHYNRSRERNRDVASRYHSEAAIAAAIRRGIRWSRRHGGNFEKAPAHIWEKMNLAQEILA